MVALAAGQQNANDYAAHHQNPADQGFHRSLLSA
jgi:hypothetical protein